MTDPNCIFCKIVDGDIPASKIYEDEHVLAFLDISQVTKGHTLVIPKNHHKDLFELPEETIKNVYAVIPKLASAIKQTYEAEGLNLVNNNGELAGQTVFHYHVHLIPRYGKGDGFGAVWKDHSAEYKSEDFTQIAREIKAFIKG
ncbi:HIT family protein [Halalkalibacter akibai]|uniref:Histidine triad (HIT) nucleotide-binding protein n=1 Tax=Halalkalibacter akibai (strain ATCC 43226 / DSM 21942 / CIP 109018 / JCM 9157 / 1139) TaxID=1236973 RepID=W4QWH3_HALA3|nr:HIT family protein [Halalkalibacter akibai]GAE35679.1 histidine triad (HIT) nucleotide-binding protein [Halalkalibacter akibai JCM 9157]